MTVPLNTFTDLNKVQDPPLAETFSSNCPIKKRALEDLNPRHQVLETCVLPTELRAQNAEMQYQSIHT